MVMTHKQLKEKKAKPIDVKPDNPARKFMTYEQALADNKAMKDDRDKIKKYADDLANARKEKIGEVIIPEGSETIEPEKETESEKQVKIAELKEEMAAIKKAPGSKAKKEAIQKEIDQLTHSY